jgi:hypothetical protein
MSPNTTPSAPTTTASRTTPCAPVPYPVSGCPVVTETPKRRDHLVGYLPHRPLVSRRRRRSRQPPRCRPGSRPRRLARAAETDPPHCELVMATPTAISSRQVLTSERSAMAKEVDVEPALREQGGHVSTLPVSHRRDTRRPPPGQRDAGVLQPSRGQQQHGRRQRHHDRQHEREPVTVTAQPRGHLSKVRRRTSDLPCKPNATTPAAKDKSPERRSSTASTPRPHSQTP